MAPRRRRTSENGSRSTKIADQWVRDIRSAARAWAAVFTPKEDMTPMLEVRDVLYTHLLEQHPDLIDQVFVTPLYTPVCTWHIIGRDVKKPLADRGFVIVPNRLADPGDVFLNTDVLFRQASEIDEAAYIELEYDLLSALLDRQERRLRNAQLSVDGTRERRTKLEAWAKEARGRLVPS